MHGTGSTWDGPGPMFDDPGQARNLSLVLKEFRHVIANNKRAIIQIMRSTLIL